MMRARPSQRTEVYLRLVSDEADRMARFNRIVQFFERSIGVGWRRILHKRKVMSEDSTARWVYKKQLPRWLSLDRLEDYAATMGFSAAPRLGRRPRISARRSVPTVAHQTVQDRVLRALEYKAPTLENRDMLADKTARRPDVLPTHRPPVSIGPLDSGLNKDFSEQLDFLSSLTPNDLQK